MLSFWAHNLSSSYGDPCSLTGLTPTRSLFYFRMARDSPRRCLRQQVRRPRCPSCGKQFTDILRHLNHSQSKCSNWFSVATPHRHSSPLHHYENPVDDPTDSPIPESPLQPPPLSQPHQPHVQCIQFPGTAKTFGQAKMFMDKFNDDQYLDFMQATYITCFQGKPSGSSPHFSSLPAYQ